VDLPLLPELKLPSSVEASGSAAVIACERYPLSRPAGLKQPRAEWRRWLLEHGAWMGCDKWPLLGLPDVWQPTLDRGPADAHMQIYQRTQVRR